MNVPTNAESADSLRVLLVAPTGRDAALACHVLLERGAFECLPCQDMDQLCEEFTSGGAGALVLAEEALNSRSLRRLLQEVSAQPAWSDIPIIVMTAARQSDAQMQELITRLRGVANVALLERPIRILTLISAVEAALRGRRRQYEVRALMREQEMAVRHRDQFLAMLGHELRNPLATITNALALLEAHATTREHDSGNARPGATAGAADSQPHDVDNEARQIIARQTRHLARLVDDLLDVARITSGKIVLRRVRLDLRHLVTEAVRSARTVASAHGHDLRLSIPQQRSITVDVDPVRIEQVLSNLLSNAIKYTPRGGKIEVAVEVSADDACAVLSVRDNGLGISPDLLPRVFDLFAQAEPTLDRAQGGMGIGLTLVRGLVELHGGSATVKSDGEGAGSEFSIMLPLASTRAAPLNSSTWVDRKQEVGASGAGASRRESTPRCSDSSDSAGGAGSDDSGVGDRSGAGALSGAGASGSGRVLIVEDNVDARRAMERLLVSWGHTVDVAEDGAAALELAASRRPRAAVVDIGLPGLDGYHVARRLRSMLGPDVQLIAMTGYGQPDDKARARAAGFDVHLVKPVDPVVLHRTIASAAVSGAKP